MSKYGRSKHLEMEGNPDKYLVVIYTNSEEERDEIIEKLRKDPKVTDRIRYRFACKYFQELFPEMFISAGKPNPKFL
jgi:hypothetical protein